MARRFDRDRIMNFGRFVWQRFVDDKCFETAGSLSYTTLISLVPITVAVFAMFAVFPMFADARNTLVGFVFNNVVPSAGEQVQDTLQGFAKNASNLTSISILVMLFSAVSMMFSIEDRLNRIWRVSHLRGWGSRLLLYWAALTLGPILLVGGIAVTSYVTAMPLLHGAASQINSLGHQMLAVLPFVVTFCTLWLMYSFIPNTKVSRRDSSIGALLGATLFEIVRWGFTIYIRQAQSYQQIYGALAAIPILLLWIYLSWVIVILAASIAASASAFDYNAPEEMLPEGAEFLGLLMVLQRFVERHRNGQGLDRAQVQAEAPYLLNVSIDDYFEELCKANLIRIDEDGTWMLCRSLDCTDLLRVYQSSQYHLPLEPIALSQKLGIELSPTLLALLAELAETVKTRLHTRLDQAYPLAEDNAPAQIKA